MNITVGTVFLFVVFLVEVTGNYVTSQNCLGMAEFSQTFFKEHGIISYFNSNNAVIASKLLKV